MATKLYTIADKSDHVRSFGFKAQKSWTSPRWVIYRLKSRWFDPSNYHVHEIDLKAGTVSKISAVAFLSIHTNPDAIRKEILDRLGLDIDLKTLESLVNSKMLNENSHNLAVQYLKFKGIKC